MCDVLHHDLELHGPLLGAERGLLDLRLHDVDEVVLLVRLEDQLLELPRRRALLHLGVEDPLLDLLVDGQLLDELVEELLPRLDRALGRLLDLAHELLDLLRSCSSSVNASITASYWLLEATRAKPLPVTRGSRQRATSYGP